MKKFLLSGALVLIQEKEPQEKDGRTVLADPKAQLDFILIEKGEEGEERTVLEWMRRYDELRPNELSWGS